MLAALALAGSLSMSMAAPARANAGNSGIMIVAISPDIQRVPYVPEDVMNRVCEGAHVETGFTCSAAWDSGAIGKYTGTPGAPQVPTTEGQERAFDARLLAAVESIAQPALTGFDSSEFEWRVVRSMPLLPIETPDGKYVWVPVEIEGEGAQGPAPGNESECECESASPMQTIRRAWSKRPRRPRGVRAL